MSANCGSTYASALPSKAARKGEPFGLVRRQQHRQRWRLRLAAGRKGVVKETLGLRRGGADVQLAQASQDVRDTCPMFGSESNNASPAHFC